MGDEPGTEIAGIRNPRVRGSGEENKNGCDEEFFHGVL